MVVFFVQSLRTNSSTPSDGHVVALGPYGASARASDRDHWPADVARTGHHFSVRPDVILPTPRVPDLTPTDTKQTEIKRYINNNIDVYVLNKQLVRICYLLSQEQLVSSLFPDLVPIASEA